MLIDPAQPFYALKNRGQFQGSPLYPHLYSDGMYVVTTSKYEVDQVRVASREELVAFVRAGFGCRMSSPEIRQQPSYISNGRIFFPDQKDSKSVVRRALHNFEDDAELDLPTTSKARREQALLRAYLLKGESKGVCVLCGKVLPSELLVAAHIKPRSSCAQEERLDFENVAALMCALGCDRLFEKGYLVVRDGLVSATERARSTHLRDVVLPITGRLVPNWNASAAYYQWHAKQFKSDS